MTEALATGPIQVRVGLHTGTPLLTEEGYIGDDVHFGARVGASLARRPGRPLACDSGARRDPAHRPRRAPPEGHRPGRLASSSSETAPSRRSRRSRTRTCPRPASSFVGREDELAEVLSRIEQGARLVTLTGPGGTGKTRLSIEAASSLVPEYKAGVFWVGLATPPRPRARHRDDRPDAGSQGRPRRAHRRAGDAAPARQPRAGGRVRARARQRSCGACPNLTLLVTSRELLRIQGEVEYAVPPLAEPEAVSLFCERSQTRALRGDRRALRAPRLAPARRRARRRAHEGALPGADPRAPLGSASTCSRAAATPIRASRPCGRRSSGATTCSPPRSSSSSPASRVFAGGCTLEAAEEVAGADLDTLQSLVEKSLLRFTERALLDARDDPGVRGRAARESGDGGRAESRHAGCYAGARDGDRAAAAGATRTKGSRPLEAELDNMRAGLASRWLGTSDAWPRARYSGRALVLLARVRMGSSGRVGAAVLARSSASTTRSTRSPALGAARSSASPATRRQAAS